MLKLIKYFFLPQASTRVIGGITIAEYDGSPRRYRPRGSNETASNASSNSDISKTSSTVAAVKTPSVNRSGRGHGLKMPGFPQRVLPPPETTSSVNTSPVAIKKETEINASHFEEEELLKFDDIPPPVKSVKIISGKTEYSRKGVSDDFDMRYEFSETRKVLDEFFQSSNDQNCLNEIGEILNKSNEEAERDFNDLEYTLRRRSPLSHEPGKLDIWFFSNYTTNMTNLVCIMILSKFGIS